MPAVRKLLHWMSAPFVWLDSLRNSYRPERHYMRGPGPASHKRAGLF